MDIEVRSFHPQRKRYFGATSLDKMFILVDASYSVHNKIKSQTGCVVSMGLGVTHCISSKKKFKNKISTEVEIVAESDYVQYNILYVMFMHHQGYLKKSNTFSRTTKVP